MRATIALGVVTVVLAVVAALWVPVAVPRLVVLPADFQTQVIVTGTFEAHAAPGSLARLTTPATLPLNATLDVDSVSADGNLLVVSQTETQKVGTPGSATQDLVLKSQFVLDRQTAQNVQDPRSWSISPNHVVNRAGSYSFTFGFGFDQNGSYPLWDDSIAASYPLTQGGNAGSAPSGGLTVTGMSGTTTKPADPVWIAALTPLQLPTALSVEQWKAAGFTVTTEQPQLAATYVVTLSTQVSIDHLTGGTANLTQQTLTIAVAPDPAGTGGTPATPLPVAINSFSETPPSVATDTALLTQDGNQVTLAKTTVPRVLWGLTLVFALLTVLVFVLHRRRSRPKASVETPDDVGS